MRSHGWLAVALATGLSACSGAGNGASTLPPAAGTTTATLAASDAAVREIQCHVAPSPAPDGATTGPSGQRIAVYPETVSLTTCATAPALVDAYENFEGAVTAYAEDPSVATVTPDLQRNAVAPTFGGLKNAWFDIVPRGAGTTRVVAVDKKGDRAYVTVTVVPCATPAPTLPPLPPPPTPTASTAPCSASRQALGTRQTATGASGGAGCGSSPTPSPTPSA